MDLKGLVLTDLPHVYPVREDSWLLAGAASARPGELVVEVGCGRGLATLAAARAGARAVGCDRNPHALRGLTAEADCLGLVVEVVRADLLDGLTRFDVIMFNPPYLATRPEERDPDPWVDLALDGGPDGLATSRRFLATLSEHLRPGGRAFLLQATPRSRPFPSLRAEGLDPPRVIASRDVPAESLRVLEFNAAAAGAMNDAPERLHTRRNPSP